MAPALRDSRRLTGPNLLWDRPGAVIDVDLPEGPDGEARVERWKDRARAALEAVGWGGEELRVRPYRGGASLALSAPRDALYAATEVNEWAWESTEPLSTAAERLRGTIDAESNPPVVALIEAAAARGVACLTDDDVLSVGAGTGAQSWPVSDLPSVDDVDWSRVHDVPVALVTGTNGKTTTVRMLAAIVRAAGRVPGYTSTDGIHVGDEVVDRGDWSGPGGARAVMRDSRVEVALLETARGGMLRRGLGVSRADAAVIINIAEDHVGEYGIHTMEDMAAAKFIVSRAIDGSGRLVLNADDEASVSYASRVDVPKRWFGLHGGGAGGLTSLREADEAAYLEDGVLVLRVRGETVSVASVDEVPATMGGAARHNVSNALAAASVATTLGFDVDAIRRGLSAFAGTDADNPGRLNLFELGGVRALVDFAHNPHGVEAVARMAAAMDAQRRLVVLGQAGDRDDGSIREMARAALPLGPDLVVVKEMTDHLRGRAPGDVPAIIEATLREAGVAPDDIVHAGSELAAVRRALAWSQPGDVLVLLTHAERDAVLALLGRLAARGWCPGEAIEG